ncbi:salicylate hydroxylase [Aaosphaeria arxii CBS 175.79]|uniref:Salicylate hydroxylase n=1 Tax=Aaosphaeria arxii CBS 175.79 TaxID=1450172 RepID=A0A6A5XG76_9PLEO|nr:salicylate hydroxylase [Aaosphaeria arxii CBS 175.79]KAF2011831.1 salicylate hydroxylase [Aaosphaeria arxii CBS 175.79]
MSQSIRIAISGGGLAGATLFNVLHRFAHLDVHIFESAAAFKEAGMAIGITRNAQAALERMGPTAVQALERAGAVPMRRVRFVVAQGEEQGRVVGEIDEKTAGKRLTSIVHRAALLRELLSDAPQDHLHASKKLEFVNRRHDGSLELQFTDGTSHDCDILIGADGIHSTVRNIILDGICAAAPRSTGVWLIMALMPYAEAQASIGRERIDLEEACEYSWLGHGTYILHNLLSEGQLVQFVIASKDEEGEHDQWRRAVSCDEIKSLYHNWPQHLRTAVEGLFCKEPDHQAMYLWEHPPVPTYVSGPLCVMGDAAHATTPWQGSGGGMSIEDSFILATLLGRSTTRNDALAALKAYDQVRRPRTQRIVESSRITGSILTGTSEETRRYIDTPGKLLGRWDFILDLDMEKHRDEAISAMDQELDVA